MKKLIASTAAALTMMSAAPAPSHAWVGHIFYHGVGAASTSAVGAMAAGAAAVLAPVLIHDELSGNAQRRDEENEKYTRESLAYYYENHDEWHYFDPQGTKPMKVWVPTGFHKSLIYHCYNAVGLSSPPGDRVAHQNKAFMSCIKGEGQYAQVWHPNKGGL